MDAGKTVKEIDVKLLLTTLKPLHAKWMVDFYHHMSTAKGTEVIMSGWKKAGITAAIDKGALAISSTLDPFYDLDPQEDFLSLDANMEALCVADAEMLEANCNSRNEDPSNEENDDDVDEEEWYLRDEGDEGRNAFNLFDDEEEDGNEQEEENN